MRSNRKINPPRASSILYSFDDFEDVVAFCKFTKKNYLHQKIYLDKNTVLFEYENKYYICFKNITGSLYALKRFCASISEFGKYIDSSELFERKIIEHGNEIIAKNAVGTIAKRFN